MPKPHPGPVVRLLRLASGLSLRGLARELGVSATYMCQVETGHGAAPSPERLRQVAQALGVAPRHLFQVAGGLEPDLEAYLLRTPEARVFLRAFGGSGEDPAKLGALAAALERTGRLPGDAAPPA